MLGSVEVTQRDVQLVEVLEVLVDTEDVDVVRCRGRKTATS